VFGFCQRKVAQAELTGGADRSGRLGHETNVEEKDQPEGCTKNGVEF